MREEGPKQPHVSRDAERDSGEAAAPKEENRANQQFERRLQIKQAAAERKQEIERLGLEKGMRVSVWTEEGLKQGQVDSLDGTWRVWVRGIDPINPDNPRLCLPFDIEEVIRE